MTLRQPVAHCHWLESSVTPHGASALCRFRRKSKCQLVRKSVRCVKLHASAHGKVQKTIFIFGLNGYTAIGIGNYLSSKGWSIKGTCRRASAEETLQLKGWTVHRFDPGCGMMLTPEAMHDLGTCTHVLSSIPPLGLPLYDPALHAQLSSIEDSSVSIGSSPDWVGYLSSTSVYGDWGGDWVDESSLCRTTSSRGLIRLEAEEVWQEAGKRIGLPVHILRLGGIYGPGRSALEAAASLELATNTNDRAAGVLAPRTVARSSSSKNRRARQKYTSRIHVGDICRVVEASMASPRPGAIYNIVDDEPAGRKEVVSYATALLHGFTLEDKGIVDAPGSMTNSTNSDAEQLEITQVDVNTDSKRNNDDDSNVRLQTKNEQLEEKRVRNGLIKKELRCHLKFPTYREGLSTIYAGDFWPFSDIEDLSFALR